jgi:hypothetical protein
VRLYLIPGLGRKKLARLTAKDVGTRLDQLRTACQCCARGLDTPRPAPVSGRAAPSGCPR